MSPCVEYVGHKNKAGYGWRAFQGTQMHAHRAAWIEANGNISQGLGVLHKCDNPACVKLEHLYLGTHAQNMRDRAERMRCKTHRLGRALATELRAKFAAGGVTKSALARAYGISTGYVSALIAGHHWK
jgi:hypothetical protein